MARKLGVVLLILLFLILLIPLGMGMVMAPCPDCDLGPPLLAGGVCLALVLVLGSLAAPQIAGKHRYALARPDALLLIQDLDPPPRLV
ncbi:MAG: hypothetical protein WD096_11210 [Actinomycetota bacterium]